MHHGRIFREVLTLARSEFLTFQPQRTQFPELRLIPGTQYLLLCQMNMYGKEEEEGKDEYVPASFDIADGFIGQAVREILTYGTVFHVGKVVGTEVANLQLVNRWLAIRIQHPPGV